MRINYWHITFTLLFVVLMIVAYGLVGGASRGPVYISVWEAVILALAAFRLTRFVVYDNITQWFRDLVETPDQYSFLGTINALVNCTWCTGLWAALVVATVHFAWPEFWFFLFILALGGAASVLQIIANLVGWQAELGKQRTGEASALNVSKNIHISTNKCG